MSALTEPASLAAGDPNVTVAFRLGWSVAALYHDDRALAATPNGNPLDRPPDALPGMSGLPDHVRATAQLEEITLAIQSLAPIASGVGVTLTDTSNVASALDDPSKHAVDRELALYQLHQSLLPQLMSVQYGLGASYSLGRALRETSFLPTDAAGLQREFQRHQTQVLSGWLDDLTDSFPPYAAFSVKAALHAWVEWVETPTETPRQREARNLFSKRPKPVMIGGVTERYALQCLKRQGTIWHSILGARTPPTAFLIAENYVDAAQRIVRRTGRMAWSFLRGWWIAVLVALAAVGVGLWYAVTYLEGSSRVAAVIVIILGGGALGWQGVGASVGSEIKQLSRPLFEAEMRDAVAIATTRTPTNAPVGVGGGAPLDRSAKGDASHRERSDPQ